MANVQYYGTGRRKHSIARVRLVAGEGNITINGRTIDNFFNYDTLIRDVKQPLVLTENENKYDVIVKVEGGGFTGQAGAIRHGIARALLKARRRIKRTFKEGWILNKRCKNEGKKEIRIKSSKKSSTILKEIIIFITLFKRPWNTPRPFFI